MPCGHHCAHDRALTPYSRDTCRFRANCFNLLRTAGYCVESGAFPEPGALTWRSDESTRRLPQGFRDSSSPERETCRRCGRGAVVRHHLAAECGRPRRKVRRRRRRDSTSSEKNRRRSRRARARRVKFQERLRRSCSTAAPMVPPTGTAAPATAAISTAPRTSTSKAAPRADTTWGGPRPVSGWVTP